MTLWGGRFDEGPDEALWAFTVSPADRRLLEVDIEGSIGHVGGLVRAGLVSASEGEELTRGLEAVLEEARNGSFVWHDTDEDVHTAVERRLGELVGEVAAKLHTGRSRNDQVALDLRLYLKRAADARMAGLRDLINALTDAAEATSDVVIPSYTHLQQAQAVPLGHHLLAHAWALMRDIQRFRDALQRIDVSPLGASAGGGSRLGLDPRHTADALGFDRVFENSLDAVSSRDVASEYLFVCTQTLVDLSRLAEELVLWATSEFGWATFSDRHTTGSSALPQKKNPDIAELARGKAGSAIGDLAGLLAVQKGLPLSYNRDLQQDKEHLFRVDEDLGRAVSAMAGMIRGASFHPPAPSSWTTALDLAEVLVGRGVAFRRAHEIVGGFVAALLAEGRDFLSASAEEVASLHNVLTGEDRAVLDPTNSVSDRRSAGGGSPDSVASQIAALRAELGG